MDGRMKEDTIAAIATAPGQGGIGIVRISGPEAEKILDGIFRPAGGTKTMESHRLVYGRILDGEEVLDECMAVIMRAPKSYTREDVAEIQSHGGTQTLNRVLDLCLRRGARMAEAGEFTRRAFLNGRIDLSRAEAVMSLIAARGEQERRAAVRQMAGGTADFIRKASDELYVLQAGLAACMDYPEEISDEEGAGQLRDGLEKLILELQEAVDERSVRLIHEGMHVTLFGIPNAGKSSLLNALTGQEKAIVTEIPGTTRDTVEGEMISDGIRVILTDTAGMRQTEDPIERIGVERSEQARQQADIALLVLDGSREPGEEEIAWLKQLQETDAVIINKSDLPQKTTEDTVHAVRPEIRCMTVSALDSGSLQPVRDFFRKSAEIGDRLAITQPRHLEAVKRAIASLREAKKTLDSWTPDMASTDLQAAQQALSEITGDRADEKLLDAVFSNFCVGK
ncbi:MAG: tRNA uridine-5-carboxymethylaminomethyl(34) synthesis GTPase MnmE [Clostridia bacterium]|nr:tRNA uridine-5-carboxymethylaminomethyl(34) synthesis GTPase MnmE [Clostridia bacterium]